MEKTYTFDQLKEDVRKEAEALRVHATKEERERLGIEQLDPSDVRLCIYGLMTGECDSARATKLIKKCARVLIDGACDLDDIKLAAEFKNYHWSPIEFYITYPEAKNANLIAYLRGETETLDL